MRITFHLLCPLLLLISSFQSGLSHGSTHELIAGLNQQIKQNPNNGQLYMQRANMHFRHDDFDHARQDIERSLALDPDQPDSLRILARIDVAQQQWQNAQRTLTQWIKIQPNASEAYYTRSQVQCELGKLTDAENDAALAVKLSPKPVLRYHTRWISYLAKNGKIEAALRGYQDIEAQYGKLPTILHSKAAFLAQQSRYDDAANVYQEIRTAHSSMAVQLWLEEAEMWQAHNTLRYTKALSSAQRAWLKLSPKLQNRPHMQQLKKSLDQHNRTIQKP